MIKTTHGDNSRDPAQKFIHISETSYDPFFPPPDPYKTKITIAASAKNLNLDTALIKSAGRPKQTQYARQSIVALQPIQRKLEPGCIMGGKTAQFCYFLSRNIHGNVANVSAIVKMLINRFIRF